MTGKTRPAPQGRPRILLVSPTPPPYGGIGLGALRMIRHIKNNGNIEMALLDTSPRWRRIEDTNLVLRIIGGSLVGLKQVFFFFKIMLKFRPNILYVRSSASLSCLRDCLFIWIAQRNGVRAIYGIHMGRIPDIAKRQNWEWRWLKRGIKKAWHTVVVGRESFEILRGEISAEKISLIPNFVEPPFISEKKDGDHDILRVLFLGWIIPAKGLGELVEAWNTIADPQWELLIIGPGHKSYIVQLRKSVLPGLSVQFRDQVDHEAAMNALRHSSILVLPSYTEGFPNVVLEAMSLGKPVIGTRVGAVPEMLMARDGLGSCGLIIEPRNSRDLANALRDLMYNHDLRVEMGNNGETRVKREYSSDIVFARWTELFASAAAGQTQEVGRDGTHV